MLHMTWLLQLFWLSAVFNFHLTARHIRGKDNVVSDIISRLDQYPIPTWYRFIRYIGLNANCIDYHISPKTLCYLQDSQQDGKLYTRNTLASRNLHMPSPPKQHTLQCEMLSSDFAYTLAKRQFPLQETQF